MAKSNSWYFDDVVGNCNDDKWSKHFFVKDYSCAAFTSVENLLAELLNIYHQNKLTNMILDDKISKEVYNEK